MSWSPSWDVEAEAGVGGQALGVHPVKDRDPPVDVVVEFDAVLAFVGAEEATDVLDHSSFEGEREGQEQGVELWPVESLAEVGASGDENDTRPVLSGGDGIGDGGLGLLAQSSRRSTSGRSPSTSRRSTMAAMWSVRWVSTRQVRPFVTASWTSEQIWSVRCWSVDEGTEHRLDRSSLVVSHLCIGVVDDQLAPSSAAVESLPVISYRVGPHWRAMMPSSPSRR